MKAGLFRPKIVLKTVESTIGSMASGASKAKGGLHYRIKQNIFQGQTFAVITESFTKVGESYDYVEGIRRRIFENGGKVVADN